MNRRTVWTVGVLLATLPFGGTAGASLIWNNGSPAVTNQGGSEMSDTIQAEDFQLTGTTDLTGFVFWSLEGVSSDYLGSINYQIVNNSSSLPGNTVFGSGTVTPTRTAAGTVLGYNQFQNDAAISLAGLVAGTYWLELHNGPLGSTAFTDFYWSWTDLNGVNTGTNRGAEFSLNPVGTDYTTNENEHAFQILGTPTAAAGTPEPGSIILTLAGAVMFGAVGRNRKQRMAEKDSL